MRNANLSLLLSFSLSPRWLAALPRIRTRIPRAPSRVVDIVRYFVFLPRLCAQAERRTSQQQRQQHQQQPAAAQHGSSNPCCHLWSRTVLVRFRANLGRTEPSTAAQLDDSNNMTHKWFSQYRRSPVALKPVLAIGLCRISDSWGQLGTAGSTHTRTFS